MKYKNYIAEFLGTMFLVFFGTFTLVSFRSKTEVVSDAISQVVKTDTFGIITIALAFGLTMIALFSIIGRISGCQINPAVTLAMLINGKITIIDFIGYILSQFLGAFAGSALMCLITNNSDLKGYGANGYGKLSNLNVTISGAIIIEIILTLIFVLTYLTLTSKEKYKNSTGIVLGSVYTLIHVIGIPLTGASINPARSLAPAVFEGGEWLSQVWLFILAPLVGAAIAAVIYKYALSEKDEVK